MRCLGFPVGFPGVMGSLNGGVFARTGRSCDDVDVLVVGFVTALVMLGGVGIGFVFVLCLPVLPLFDLRSVSEEVEVLLGQ